jgi:ferric-chelate reductase
MDMGMGSDGGSSSTPLNSTGVDFSNETQAFDFLQQILDDSVFQVTGNQYARYFWYGVVVVIGIAGIFNVVETVTLKNRLIPLSKPGQWRSSLTKPNRIKSAAVNHPRPAVPTNIFMKSVATITAIFREASYPQYSLSKTASWLKFPPLGTIQLLLAYLGFVLALEFINNDIPGGQHYTAIGVRAAWLAVAQVPLLILLVGKNNLISLITGVSYERLNVLHRWVSRVLLLLATIHFGSQSYGWNKYGVMQLEWQTDTCPPTGIAAYALLLWLNLSTLAPFRHFSYEFFVVQHIITFFGFIIAVMYHLPSTALYSRVYIYIPIALYLVDRIIRSLRYAYLNTRPGYATMEAMEGGVTKIQISNKALKKWAVGSHVLLSIRRFGFGQSHPATIASTPTSHSGDLVFILKTRKGFTKRIMKSALSSSTSLLPSIQQSTRNNSNKTKHLTLLDGPYGGSHADLAAFDTVVLISGSTGISFTLPQFLDIADRASVQNLPVKRLVFIWIIKNMSWTAWVKAELVSAIEKAKAAGTEVSVQIFVTCDDNLTDGTSEAIEKECGCQCDKSIGPCCCTTVSDDESEQQAPTPETSSSQIKTIQESIPKPRAATSTVSEKKPSTLSTLATFTSGRPSFRPILWELADQAEGEMGIAACGPLGLSTSIRNTVAQISDDRAVHKGTGAQGIYLHVESFCW